MTAGIDYSDCRRPEREAVLELYRAMKWSSSRKPEALYRALLNSHRLVTAWDGDRLIGLANAISDGHLVVYYPHALVHPDYQGRGVGGRIMGLLMRSYEGFHQQALLADKEAVEFYQRCGFERAGETVPMWIFDGDEH